MLQVADVEPSWAVFGDGGLWPVFAVPWGSTRLSRISAMRENQEGLVLWGICG